MEGLLALRPLESFPSEAVPLEDESRPLDDDGALEDGSVPLDVLGDDVLELDELEDEAECAAVIAVNAAIEPPVVNPMPSTASTVVHARTAILPFDLMSMCDLPDRDSGSGSGGGSTPSVRLL
ncbi:hypothetical protein [Amnibacterium endophyticum]|uniref:Uncharacterized protein n=1 Tax=Amnibacterium endophyticum TaxID=2109337 RepID=A0ABW4LH40_9MICO